MPSPKLHLAGPKRLKAKSYVSTVSGFCLLIWIRWFCLKGSIMVQCCWGGEQLILTNLVYCLGSHQLVSKMLCSHRINTKMCNIPPPWTYYLVIPLTENTVSNYWLKKKKVSHAQFWMVQRVNALAIERKQWFWWPSRYVNREMGYLSWRMDKNQSKIIK